MMRMRLFEGFRVLALLLCGLVLLSGCKYKGDDLLHAVEEGDEQAVRKILKKGVSADSTDRRGYTALYFASYRGHKAIAELLLDNGADVNAKGDTGYTPLHGAAMGGHVEIVELLLQRGADPNARSVHGWTPAMEAHGNKDVLDALARASKKDGT